MDEQLNPAPTAEEIQRWLDMANDEMQRQRSDPTQATQEEYMNLARRQTAALEKIAETLDFSLKELMKP